MEYLVVLLFPGPQLRWPAMLRSTLLDRQTRQDGRGGQACLTWSRKWYAIRVVCNIRDCIFFLPICLTAY